MECTSKKKGGNPLTTLGAVALGIVAVVGFIAFLGKAFTSMTIFIMAPGAFLVLAFLVAMMNIIRNQMEHKGTPLAKPSGCISGDCASCSMHGNCADEAANAERGTAETIIITQRIALNALDSRLRCFMFFLLLLLIDIFINSPKR